jgi:hypothetical protein
MHAASHTFQYPKVTPVAPAGTTKPASAPEASTTKRPQR